MVIPIRGITSELKSKDDLAVFGKGAKQAKSKQASNCNYFLALLAGNIDFASETNQQDQTQTIKASDPKYGSASQLETTLKSVLMNKTTLGNPALVTILAQLGQNQSSDQANPFVPNVEVPNKLEGVIAQLLKDLNGNLQDGAAQLQNIVDARTGTVGQTAKPEDDAVLKNTLIVQMTEAPSGPKQAIPEIGVPQYGNQFAQSDNKSGSPASLNLIFMSKGTGPSPNGYGQQSSQINYNQPNVDKTTLPSLPDGSKGGAQETSKPVLQVNDVVRGSSTEVNHHNHDNSWNIDQFAEHVTGAIGSYSSQADQKLEAKDRTILSQIVSNLSQQLSSQKPDVNKFSIQLHPAELGKIEIAVRWEDGKLHLECQASQPQTNNSLERGLPQLRHTLEGMGISCGSMQMGMDGQPHQEHRQTAPNIVQVKANENEEWSPVQSDQLMTTPVAEANSRVNLVV